MPVQAVYATLDGFEWIGYHGVALGLAYYSVLGQASPLLQNFVEPDPIHFYCVQYWFIMITYSFSIQA